MAASEYAKQVIHMRGLLKAMDFDQGPPTTVYEDNTACVVLKEGMMRSPIPSS